MALCVPWGVIRNNENIIWKYTYDIICVVQRRVLLERWLKKKGIMNRFIFSDESRWVGLYKGNFCSSCKCFIFQHFGWQSSKWDIHLNNLTVWSLQTNSMWSVYKNNWGRSYDLRTFICLYSFTECLNLLKQPAHHITKCVDCYLFLIWPHRET